METDILKKMDRIENRKKEEENQISGAFRGNGEAE